MTENNCILLTALGKEARESNYQLGEKKESARLSSIALAKMLDKKPNRIVALCTKAAEDTYDILKKEMEAIKIPCEKVTIPEGKNNDEVSEIMKKILGKIPEKSELILELTQGLRHIPFLFFAAALYLSTLKEVKIEGVYYGMMEVKRKDKDGLDYCPFVDLRILLEMADWFQAVKAFKEDRHARPLIKLLKDKKNNLPKPTCKENNVGGPYKNFLNHITNLSLNYGAGLPLEFGKDVDAIISDILEISDPKRKEILDSKIPLFPELIMKIKESAEPYKFTNTNKPGTSKDWKKEIVLDERELEREAKLIDEYLENGLYANAIGLIREWIVSRVIASLNKCGEKITWIEHKEREKIERILGSLYVMTKEDETRSILNEEHKWLGEIWNDFGKIRNKIHHHGMREDNVELEIEEIKNKWEEVKGKGKDDKWWNAKIGGGEGVLLVSPLGLSSGSLYSALVKVQGDLKLKPNKVVVISSKDGVKKLDEVKNASKYDGDIEPILFEDPHAGFNEIKKIVNETAKHLKAADEVVVNVTGGTTAMQHAVNEITKEAEGLGKKVTQIALVDRRPVEEQRKNPYVAGELIILTKEEKE